MTNAIIPFGFSGVGTSAALASQIETGAYSAMDIALLEVGLAVGGVDDAYFYAAMERENVQAIAHLLRQPSRRDYLLRAKFHLGNVRLFSEHGHADSKPTTDYFKVEEHNPDLWRFQNELLDRGLMEALYGSVLSSIQTTNTIEPRVFYEAFFSIARDIRSRIEDGERFDEVFHKILAYYEPLFGWMGSLDASSRLQLLTNRKRFLNYLAKVRSEFEQLSCVAAVYNTGFPFHGFVDVRKRMFFTLMELFQGKRLMWHALKRMMPDYDMIVVYNLDKTHYEISERSPVIFYERWIQHLNGAGKQEWEALSERLRRAGISQINIWGPRETSFSRREDYLSYLRSFRSGQMTLDVAHPTPLSVWENLPVFIQDEDLENIPVLSSLLLVRGPVSLSSRAIVGDYRMNLLLFQLSGGPRSQDNILNTLSKKRREGSHAPFLSAIPEARKIFSRRWTAVLHRARGMGLVHETFSNLFELTPLGRIYLKDILQRRKSVVERGQV